MRFILRISSDEIHFKSRFLKIFVGEGEFHFIFHHLILDTVFIVLHFKFCLWTMLSKFWFKL